MEKITRTGLASYLKSHLHKGGIIVCENPKFIYMKPAKTAGTSILRQFLEKEVDGIFHYKDHPNKFNNWLDNITDEQLEDYYMFSVIRNPWDRFASVATYFNLPFKDFTQNLDHYWKDQNIKIHSLPIHLYTHINATRFVDFICRYESLQSDFNLVLDKIGVKRKELPYVNKSKNKHYSHYYDEYEIEKVKQIYQYDIEYYGYSFQTS